MVSESWEQTAVPQQAVPLPSGAVPRVVRRESVVVLLLVGLLLLEAAQQARADAQKAVRV